jgi:hypothetical protein
MAFYSDSLSYYCRICVGFRIGYKMEEKTEKDA